MKKRTMTREIAWALAKDRADARMRDGGRKAWDVDDYNHAVHTFNQLWPKENDQ